MRKIFIMITVTALLSSCGVINRVTKNKSLEKSKDESSLVVKTKTDLEVVDNSTTTITENYDTEVTTKRVEGKSNKKITESDKTDLANVKSGLTILDDQFLTLNQIYNEKDSVLTTSYVLKPQPVPVPTEKKTVIQNDIKTKTADVTNSKQETKSKQVNRDAIIERRPDYAVIIIIGILVLIALCLYLLRKRMFKI